MDPEWRTLSLLMDSVCSFSTHDKDVVLRCFTKIEVGKNQIIVRSGEVCNDFFFVYNGCLRTYFITSSAQERTRLILPSISIGTAFASFITASQSFEFLDSLEDSTLLKMERDSFYSLLDQIPAWRVFYQKILEMAYVFQNARIEQLVSYTAAERYELLIKERPELLQVVPGKILASYLDISPETLSRLRAIRS